MHILFLLDVYDDYLLFYVHMHTHTHTHTHVLDGVTDACTVFLWEMLMHITNL